MTDVTRSALTAAARQRAGNDPIFALNADARARSAAGEDILNATLGVLTDEDGRIAIMPSVLDAIASVPAARAAGYAPISGVPDFLNAAIHDLFGDGPLADQAVAVSTPGGTGAIYQTIVNFLEPGERALTTSYFWNPYRTIAEHARRGIDVFNMFDEDGTLDTSALAGAAEEHVSSQGRVVLCLNFPCHNPTGYSLEDAEWGAVSEVLARVATRGPVTVLLDVAYLHFAGPGAQRALDAIPSLLEHSTVLIAWTASKGFTQYGARVGSLVALHRDPEERTRLKAALSYSCRATWSNCNHRGQLAVTQLLTDPELSTRALSERAALRDMLDARVAAFNDAMRGGPRAPRYEDGFFVSVFTPDAQRTAASMRDEGVYVVPLDGAVRAAICSTPADRVQRLVDALKRGVAAATP